MFTWIIKDKLAKAGYGDETPAGIQRAVVAAEYAEGVAALVDEPIDTPEQRRQLAVAVGWVIRCLAFGMPTVVVCQQGRSRSPLVACLAAALWEQTSFQTQWLWLREHDNTVHPHSPLEPLARQMFPNLFGRKWEYILSVAENHEMRSMGDFWNPTGDRVHSMIDGKMRTPDGSLRMSGSMMFQDWYNQWLDGLPGRNKDAV